MSLKQKKVLLFAHADGDGHLAAEQSRINIEEKGFSVERIIIDHQKTRSWRFWENHFFEEDLNGTEAVFIVDIMLNPKDPRKSLEAIAAKAEEMPSVNFYIKDHHPIKDQNFLMPQNVFLKLVISVFYCCFGEPGDLMLIASICDKDIGPIKDQITEKQKVIAKGINRAVKEPTFVGETILKMIQNDCWDLFESLGNESNEYHRTYYGNRIDKNLTSPLLQVVDALSK